MFYFSSHHIVTYKTAETVPSKKRCDKKLAFLSPGVGCTLPLRCYKQRRSGYTPHPPILLHNAPEGDRFIWFRSQKSQEDPVASFCE